ncbi:DUF1330 domain-containing protein [uncultured Litoreibacter sp.]|uniref:DUF1330 domain-containing protein n=1 Tax=uncultured Litoreibacter sp. TaxID=1392394 RepID=UPI00262C90CD|nr:DUF1330 domain-containing protein [uncultured Litoreibacter sp.]
MNKDDIQNDLTSAYGSGSDGSAPRGDQWASILNRDPNRPVTLINFFKFREIADYGDKTGSTPGNVAFDQYAAVSIPTMERVGGKFLLVAPFEASLIGENEEWDLVAIGSYPNQKAFLDLYQDAAYRGAFEHRTAACARQKVLIVDG